MTSTIAGSGSRTKQDRAKRVVILTDGPGTYPDDIRVMREQHGYDVVELSPRLGKTQVRSPLSLAYSMLVPHVLKYRRALRDADVVIVFNWYLLPLLALQRLHLVRRPRQVISLFLFIQSPRAERIANRLVRLMKFGNEWFIVSGSLLRERIIEMAGIPPDQVENMPYRRVGGLPAREGTEGDYLFAGGYTNRDYDTFISAIMDTNVPVTILALPANKFGMIVPDHVSISTAFGSTKFEDTLAASKLVVLPIRPHGTSAGQSVLLQALQFGKPVIATRHPGLVDFLGEDHPGYVEPANVTEMHDHIQKALQDPEFMTLLAEASERCRATVDSWTPYCDSLPEFIERTKPS